MRIDTQTIHATSAGAATGARSVRWVPIVATVLATTAAVLVASGLAVVMNLS